MTIFRLSEAQEAEFAKRPEVFSGVQLGVFRSEFPCLVVGGLVGILFDERVWDELNGFYESTWDGWKRFPSEATIEQRYKAWLDRLERFGDISPTPSSRLEIMRIVSEYTYDNPPPNTDNNDRPAPPDRIDLRPLKPEERPQELSKQYGHLPFRTTTRADEVFYRWESWPKSLRISQEKRTIAPQTCAAPQSEVQFCPTGFGAVGRFALPSFFPHVFRYEIQPDQNTVIYCGASVPMFGQAGGGVEVYFVNGATNRGPIANPVVLPSL